MSEHAGPALESGGAKENEGAGKFSSVAGAGVCAAFPAPLGRWQGMATVNLGCGGSLATVRIWGVLAGVLGSAMSRLKLGEGTGNSGVLAGKWNGASLGDMHLQPQYFY